MELVDKASDFGLRKAKLFFEMQAVQLNNALLNCEDAKRLENVSMQGFFYTPLRGVNTPNFFTYTPYQFDLVTPVGSSLGQMHKIWIFCMKFGHLVLRKII